MQYIRARVLGVLIAVLAISAFVAAPEVASAVEPSPLSNESCESGFVCVWGLQEYQGTRESILCTGGKHNVGLPLGRSAKNRCANKAAWLREEGVAHACLNPGTNFPAREFTEVWVGAEGSRC